MAKINYKDSQLPIHEDYAEAHNRFWDRLSKAGAWFNAEERIAIASEVRLARECTLCQQRKAALSPMHVKGDHDSNSGLSEIIVDVRASCHHRSRSIN